MKNDAARDFLVRQLDSAKTDSVRVAAAQQLWNRKHPGVVEKVIAIWSKTASNKESSWDDSFETCVEFLARSGRLVAVHALAAGFEKRPPDQRLEIVETLGEEFASMKNESFPSEMAKRNPEPEAIQAAIALLAKALEDTEARDGMSGNRGEFQYSDPRICDFALWALHASEPETYAFSPKATKRKRDEERIKASNVWRLANKLPLLPEPSSSLPVLGDKEALRITSITVEPKDASNEIATITKKLIHTDFTPQAISALLLWFARNEIKGVKGLSIEASREDDLRGVAIEVVLTPSVFPRTSNRTWGTHYNIVIDGQSVGNSTGSASSSSMEQDDAWQDFINAANKVNTLAPKQPFLMRARIQDQ